MTISSLSPTFNLNTSVSDAKNLLNDLQRQLATGKKATTYGGLGNDRTQVLSFRAELSQLEGYTRTATIAETRLQVTQLALNDIRDLTADTKADSVSGEFSIEQHGQSNFQVEARARFVNIIGLLNTRSGDNYVFAGRNIQSPPTAAAEDILDGSGSKAGFRQVAEERRLADLGTGLGRLAISSPTTDSVQLAEDGATHPFGFKIASVQNALTGTTVSGPTGSPVAADVTFGTTLPSDGETITFTLDLPDGTSTDVTLTARTDAPTEPGEFQIGADADATAANFQTALNDVITQTAQSDLRAASLFAAADDFFNVSSTQTPQRVVGPPFESATTLTDATPTDTIIYYSGEISDSSARSSVVAKVDDSITVNIGARANEEAFQEVLKNMAVLAVETFDPADANSKARYSEMAYRVNTNLQFQNGAQSVDNIITELTVSQDSVGRAEQRHTASETLLQSFVDERENADIYEVSASILSLQTRLEASLSVTASLSRISLINFLN